MWPLSIVVGSAVNQPSVCPSHADPSVHSHCSLGASCFTLLLCPHDVAAFDGKDDGDKEDKSGRDGNDYHGQAVQSGNPSPMMAGHQPARKWPMQMSKVKASRGSCQRSCQWCRWPCIPACTSTGTSCRDPKIHDFYPAWHWRPWIFTCLLRCKHQQVSKVYAW